MIATAMRTLANKMLNEHNKRSSCALCTFVHFTAAVICKSELKMTHFQGLFGECEPLQLDMNLFVGYSARVKFYPSQTH